MVCQRCQGLLVCEIFDDLNIESDSLYTGTRCINCGCIEDAIVRANRVRPAVRARATSRGRVRTRDVERITIPLEAYASIR
jgi:methenyltetrahydromethanopterin cyclohydrolase